MRNRTMAVFETATAIYLSRYYPIIRATNIALDNWLKSEEQISGMFFIKGVHLNSDKNQFTYENGVFSTVGTIEGGEMHIKTKIDKFGHVRINEFKFEHFSYPNLPKRFVYGRGTRRPRLLSTFAVEGGLNATEPARPGKLFISFSLALEMYNRYSRSIGSLDLGIRGTWPAVFMAAPEKIITSAGGVVDKYGVVYLE